MGTRVKQLRTVAAFSVLLSILCPPTAHAVRNDSSRMKTIFVFGDSLSDGFQLKRSQAYPALLLDKLRADGLDFEVVNASQSGGTTTGGIARLPPHLKRKIDIFILELGINDAFLGVPIDQIEANLQWIVDQVKARNPNVRVIIAGLQLPNYSADDYVSAFGRMYVDLAAKNKAALVPYLLEGVGGKPDLNLGDGIHPNAAGQKILAENVWRVLERIAREVATGSTEKTER
ncbi:MAG TPA: arylesterase [Chthoniobacterales bacterium]|jgi:acyl-CoA thioesterase-1